MTDPNYVSDSFDEQKAPDANPTQKKPKFTPKFKVAGRGFVAFPAFFIDELMPLGPKIPATFWQFLLIVWRDVNHHKDNACKKALKKFYMREASAGRWTAALQASGLFHVKYGHGDKDRKNAVPTVLTYLDADFEEWEIFIEALAEQLQADKAAGYNDYDGGFVAGIIIRMFRIRGQRFGQMMPKWAREHLVTLEKHGFVTGTKDEHGVFVFVVTKRKKSDRAGVLSTYEKVNGSYPSQDATEYDYETGKQIRWYRKPYTAVSHLTVDLSAEPEPERKAS